MTAVKLTRAPWRPLALLVLLCWVVALATCLSG
jgi:hypothetical protein